MGGSIAARANVSSLLRFPKAPVPISPSPACADQGCSEQLFGGSALEKANSSSEQKKFAWAEKRAALPGLRGRGKNIGRGASGDLSASAAENASDRAALPEAASAPEATPSLKRGVKDGAASSVVPARRWKKNASPSPGKADPTEAKVVGQGLIEGGDGDQSLSAEPSTHPHSIRDTGDVQSAGAHGSGGDASGEAGASPDARDAAGKTAAFQDVREKTAHKEVAPEVSGKAARRAARSFYPLF